jgi:hypothetical protein
MKMKSLLAVAGLIAAGTAFAHDNGGDRYERNVLFRFDGGTGVQPFRSQAGAAKIWTNSSTGSTASGWMALRFSGRRL